MVLIFISSILGVVYKSLCMWISHPQETSGTTDLGWKQREIVYCNCKRNAFVIHYYGYFSVGGLVKYSICFTNIDAQSLKPDCPALLCPSSVTLSKLFQPFLSQFPHFKMVIISSVYFKERNCQNKSININYYF